MTRILDPGFIQLPFDLSVGGLLADLARFTDADWTAHGNSQIIIGVWSVIPIRAIAGFPNPDRCVVSNPHDYTWGLTPQGRNCSYVRGVLQHLPCQVYGVRFMRLEPRSRLHSHVDPSLAWQEGIVRLHVPVVSSELASFVYEGVPHSLQPGQVWYFDLTRPHFPVNDGDTSRIHLTIDCAGGPEWEPLLGGGKV